MSTPNPNLVSHVLKTLEGVFTAYETDAKAASLSKSDAETAADKANGTRTTQLMVAAAAAHKANWPNDVIAAAVKQFLANERPNMAANSAATFGGQLKNAMKDTVRGSVPSIVGTCNKAWQAERDALAADKKALTPCRDAWGSKVDHAIVKFIGDKAKGLKVPANEQELLSIARELNPAKQVEKTVKQLKAAHDILVEFKGNSDVDMILTVLGAIDAKKLSAMRAAKTAVPAADTSEPVEGVSDIGSDMLDAATQEAIAQSVSAAVAQMLRKAA